MENSSFVIITGLSGAGKSNAVKVFEDMGYFCVDNLPAPLIPKFAELCSQSAGKVDKMALVIDIRGDLFLNELNRNLDELRKMEIPYQILFLEASDDVLIQRFKETRRNHPLSPQGTVSDGIAKEREKLSELRGRADKIMDTSRMKVSEFRTELRNQWEGISDKLFFAFPLMMFLMAGMLMPAWIEMSEGNPFQFLSFLAAAGIIFVGAAPSFKRSDLENSVHQWSAYLAAAFAILWIVLVPHLWYIVAIVLTLHIVVAICTKTVKTSYIYWLESVAFISTFISIVFYGA